MAETMLAAEAALYQLVTSREFITGDASQKEVRQVVFDTVAAASFVDLLKKTLTILKPINSAITFYQSDSVPVSEVYATFANKLLTATMNTIMITQEERA
jgi:hypothetical protein